MGEQAEFIRAWRAWNRTDPPTENFRLGRSRAATYGVELDLDHLVTSIYATIQGFFDRRPWDHRRRLGDYLEELHRMEAELASLTEAEAQAHRIRDFILATRSVLHSFGTWVRAHEQV